MSSSYKRSIQDRLKRIVTNKDKDDVLIAIWDTAPFLNSLAGVESKNYYYDVEVKLKVQIWFQEQFPDFVLFPGIWADYGAVCEPSAFGCEIKMKGDSPAVVSPAIKSTSDIMSLKAIDPLTAGLLPKALNEYGFFWKHLDRKYIDKYGYLDGVATSFGPVELAAVLMGYENFFTALWKEAQSMHTLFRITTDFVISWLKAQEDINGPLKRIALADHIPGQINQQHFKEYFVPYTNQVLEAFPKAIRLYHNEFPINYISSLSEIRADIFHFGTDIVETKKCLGEKMTLMGNVHPVSVLWNGTPEDVKKESLYCLEKGTPGGRFLLSSGGGLSPGTPMENVKAMHTALGEFRKSLSN